LWRRKYNKNSGSTPPASPAASVSLKTEDPLQQAATAGSELSPPIESAGTVTADGGESVDTETSKPGQDCEVRNAS
jgi:hypothetical protein